MFDPRRLALTTGAALTALALLGAAATATGAGLPTLDPLLRQYAFGVPTAAADHARLLETLGARGPLDSSLGLRCLIQTEPGQVTHAALAALGVTVTGQAGPVFTASIPAAALVPVAGLPGVVRVQSARVARLSLDVAMPEVEVRPDVHGGEAPPYTGNTGAGGVLLGIVDSGFDYRHEDFRTGAGQSRFCAIWDQEDDVTGPNPSGYSYGTEWLQASLDDSSSTHTDTDGHGTHVAGIAGGNGRGTDGDEPIYTYVGMAPEATLAGVGTTLLTPDILDGVSYLFDKATTLGVDAVVNLSLGHDSGPHDGTDPFDVAINGLTGPGRLVVAAAGNSRTDGIHARGTVPAADSLDFVYTIPSYTPNAGPANDLSLMDVWWLAAADYTVQIITPNGHVVGPVAEGDSAEVDNPDGSFCIFNGVTSPANGDNETFIGIFDAIATTPPAAGAYTLRFVDVGSGKKGAVGFVDAWAWASTFPVPPGARFTSGDTEDVTLGSPATADSAVAVAAYMTRVTWPSTDGNTYGYQGPPPVGDFAFFSSRGPTRTGGQKPDIAAPGMGIASTLSTGMIPPEVAQRITPDDRHRVIEGTSMASPMVAGLGALLLNAPGYGGMTPSGFKFVLGDHARTDGFTGAVPNPDWGSGKISGQSAIVAVIGGDPTPPLTLRLSASYPNPLRSGAGALITFGLPGDGHATLRLYDVNGRQVAILADRFFPAGTHTVRWDGRVAGDDAASGIYFYQLDAAEKTRTRKLVVVR